MMRWRQKTVPDRPVGHRDCEATPERHPPVARSREVQRVPARWHQDQPAFTPFPP